MSSVRIVGLVFTVASVVAAGACGGDDFTETGAAGPGGASSSATTGTGTGASSGGGGGSCENGLTACGSDGCVDTDSSVDHCGGCDKPCTGMPNADPQCAGGKCVLGPCTTGFADCDRQPDNGCEENLIDNMEHCGACATVCGIECKGMSCNDVAAVSAGNSFACALRQDGSVWCWGLDYWGNLGSGVGGPDQLAPVKVSLPKPAIQVSANPGDARFHACAVLDDGTVWCWGANGNGQLGINSTSDSPPAQVLNLTDAVAVATGGGHTCAITSSKQLYCWGSNGFGELGLGNQMEQHTPQAVVGGIDEIAIGMDHGCARGALSVSCWGQSNSGQVGLGGTSNVLSPVKLQQGMVDSASLAASYRDSCSVSPTGELRCWGENSNYQMANGTMTDAVYPTVIAAATDVAQAAVGAGHMGYVTTTGLLYLWGNNGAGQVGDGTANPVGAPKDISTPNALPPMKSLSLGGGFSCALGTNGKLYCWGAGALVGDGTGANKSTPVEVKWN